MKNNDVLFNGLETYMIALLRYGVLDERPDTLMPLSQVEWDRMMDIASAQGILAWVWDGICKIPKEFQPPRQQSINWGLSAQEIWDRYAHQKSVLENMLDICRHNNIRLLLFKGIALSELYPKPESRPSGDIDIYLFEDYCRGDELFAQTNVTRTNKRTGFDYEGVHIENHRIFLNTYSKTQINAVQYLEESLKDVSLSKDGYYFMSPIANIVYQVMHFIAHIDDISSPFSLRFVVDFGMTLKKYHQIIDSKELKLLLVRLNILGIFCVILGMVEKVMRMDFSQYHFQEVKSNNLYALSKIMLSRPQDSVPFTEKTFRERFIIYYSRYCSLRSLFKYLPVKNYAFITKSLKELFSVSIRKCFNLPDNMSLASMMIRMKGN